MCFTAFTSAAPLLSNCRTRSMELLLIGFAAGFAHVVTGPDHLAALAPFASRNGRAALWRLGLRWGLDMPPVWR